MEKKLLQIHLELGITSEHLHANRLAKCEQPPLESLEVVDIDFEGKPFLLQKNAASGWRQMSLAAQGEGVELLRSQDLDPTFTKNG